MASVGPATTEGEARQSWVSAYPFEPYNGGDGVTFEAGTSTSSVALVGVLQAAPPINSVLICNQGNVWVSVKLGGVGVVATLGNMAIPPGACALVSFTTQNSPIPLQIAAITRTGTAWLQVTCGYGGN